MRNTYSLYEAKAKLSAIVRKVREGQPVIVTLHGKPVVEIRSISSEGTGLDSRIEDLNERGILVRRENKSRPLKKVIRKRGALKRFLDDREG